MIMEHHSFTTHLPADWPAVPMTLLATASGSVVRFANKHGAVVITRHHRPEVILMTFDEYARLKAAADYLREEE